MVAIISGDIVGSTMLSSQDRQHILNTLNAIIEDGHFEGARYQVTRGDFLQLETNAADGLRATLMLKFGLNSLVTDNAGIATQGTLALVADKHDTSTKASEDGNMVINKSDRPYPQDSISQLFVFEPQPNFSTPQRPKKTRLIVPKIDARISLGVGKVTLYADTLGASDGPAFQLSGRGVDTLKANKGTFNIAFEDSSIDAAADAALLEVITDNITQQQSRVLYLLLCGLKEAEIAHKLGISQSAINQQKKAANYTKIQFLLGHYQSQLSKIVMQ